MESKIIHRGDIFYIQRFPTCGSEQQASRPAIVVSNDSCNANSSVIEVVYLTSQIKKKLPTHVEITSIGRSSIVLCEQITSVSVERVGDYKCHVTPEELLMIDQALAVSIGIFSMNQDGVAGEDHSDDDRLLALVCLKYLRHVLGDNLFSVRG